MAAPQAARQRIGIFDTIRAFTICSMVAFHTMYDLVYIFGLDVAFFQNGLIQDVWRYSISWTFLFLAGWMTSLSRSNLRRCALYGAGALVVWVATSAASVDDPIDFGILFCMAGSTTIYLVARPLFRRVDSVFLAALFALLFLFTLDIPRHLYGFSGFAWLGFPYPGYYSGDYYPLLPYSFMYLAGAASACAFSKRHPEGYPEWMTKEPPRLVRAVSRNSLWIYLAHQPVVLLALTAILGS